MPNLLDLDAGLVTRLLILHERVKRLALVGPLPGAVVPSDDGVVAVCLGVGSRGYRRPGLRTIVVTNTLAAARGILVVGVNGHAVLVDQHAVFGFERGL